MPDPTKVRAILDPLPVNLAVKSAAWQAFGQDDPQQFQAQLDGLALPQAVKSQLWQLKQAEMLGPGGVAPAAPTAPDASGAATGGDGQSMLRRAAGMVGDVAIGAGKGLVKDVIGAGRLVASMPLPGPMPGQGRLARFSDVIDGLYGVVGQPVNSREALDEALAMPTLAPANTAQRGGQLAEQIASFFLLPSGKGKLLTKMATEAAGAAGLTAVQGGNPLVGGVTGAAGPVLNKAVTAAGPRVAASARESVARFFAPRRGMNPTTGGMAAEVEKQTPQILARAKETLGGVTGTSREAALVRYEDARDAAGKAIDTFLKTHGADKVPTTPFLDEVAKLKDTMIQTREVAAVQVATDPNLSRFVSARPPSAPGMVVLETVIDPKRYRQVQKLEDLMRFHGTDLTLEQARGLRQVWDRIGYPKTGSLPAGVKAQSEKWANRKLGNILRTELAKTHPDLTVINQEFSFWNGLSEVLNDTLQRTRSTGHVIENTAAVATGAATAATGGLAPAAAVAASVKGLSALLRSPRWASVSAQLKNQLADALASHNTTAITYAMNRIGVATAAQASR